MTIGGFRLPEQTGEARALLGLVPQEIAVYDVLSPRRNLSFFGGLYGLRGPELASRVNELLEGVDLADRADHAIHTFSGGMQRRVNIAAALVHQPRIVFLDEPTVGLDPALREDIWQIIRELKARGTTLVLTTHYMEEAEALCDRVAIMDRGKVVAIGSPSELVGRAGVKTSLILAVAGNVAAGLEAVRKLSGAEEAQSADGRLRVTTPDRQPALTGRNTRAAGGRLPGQRGRGAGTQPGRRVSAFHRPRPGERLIDMARLALLIGWKDCLVRFQSRVTLIFVVALPLALTIVSGLAFQGFEVKNVSTVVALVDAQASDLWAGTAGHLPPDRITVRRDLSAEEARQAVEEKKIDGAILVGLRYPDQVSAELFVHENQTPGAGPRRSRLRSARGSASPGGQARRRSESC